MSKLHIDLVQWYKQNKRDLAFRANQDPYRIWISEIMAQQTQIDTLLPYYERWMHRYPDLKALFVAEEEDLYRLWEGLGYYSRVKNIQKAAQQIRNDHQSTFPKTKEAIQTLAGIGDYTAAAIASICFNEKQAAIDGNVKRVMSRLFLWDETILRKEFNKQIKNKIETWMNDVNPGDLTQALMELGALICTKQAKCEHCPLKPHCLALQNNVVDAYPKAAKQLTKQTEQIDVVLLINKNNEFALTLDHSDSLMQGYYRLPSLKQVNITDAKKDGTLRHVFSHKIWEVNFYIAKVKQNHDFKLVNYDESLKLPIITLHRKWLKQKSSLIQSQNTF
jgi:A/G-specific adenine glycosylase